MECLNAVNISMYSNIIKYLQLQKKKYIFWYTKEKSNILK